MNLTAIALSSKKFQRIAIRDFVHARYPKIARARSASRLVRSDGSAQRYVYLYDHPLNGKCIGKCLPKTMDMLVEAGLWDYSSGSFTDHSPDTTYDHWFPAQD